MAVPARKTSKSKRDKRRTHFKLAKTNVITCGNCGASIKSHRVCKECGFYRKKEVLKQD